MHAGMRRNPHCDFVSALRQAFAQVIQKNFAAAARAGTAANKKDFHASDRSIQQTILAHRATATGTRAHFWAPTDETFYEFFAAVCHEAPLKPTH